MRFSFCLSCLAIFFQTLLFSETIDAIKHSHAESYDFWVSENGCDSNSGSKHSPFRTLQRARDAVRSLPSRAFQYHDVNIYLRGGTYRLKKTLTLTSKDSGRYGHNVIWRAAPGEHPLICGSVHVTGWGLYDASLNIYRAYVGPCQSRQLYVNGKRATRAQTTPYPAAFLPSWTAGGIEFIPTSLNPAAWRDPATWTNPQDIEAVIITQWKMMRVPISSIAPYNSHNNGLIVMQEPAWKNANVYFDSTTNLPGIWSFWQVTRFENAYEFLTEKGQWYLDRKGGWLYYIPLAGEDLSIANVELPLVETLIQGMGTLHSPIRNIQFKGLNFAYATWQDPSGSNGYIADQSGFILVGSNHQPNYVGHDQHVVPSRGNLSFTYAKDILFYGNSFQHLGGVGIHFVTGCRDTVVKSNLFTDISSSAIILGGVSEPDAHPKHYDQTTRNNKITNNLIRSVGVEYVDAAGIFVGFSRKTSVSHNTIVDVPWSGIAMGWGWGLMDKGSFPGMPHATHGLWGNVTKRTANYGCKIFRNKITDFLNVVWDGGAIYTTGQQGPSLSKGLLIKENVAYGKRVLGGGNTFYTDGGSRYIRLEGNISYDNPIGVTYFGPPPRAEDPLPYSSLPSDGNNIPYGSDTGGCCTYGDIHYKGNYWLQTPIPDNIVLYNSLLKIVLGFPPYSSMGFFDLCPFERNGVSYPTRLMYSKNKTFDTVGELPQDVLSNAGVQSRPSTIPRDVWVLPFP
jgi:hypothetical protein